MVAVTESFRVLLATAAPIEPEPLPPPLLTAMAMATPPASALSSELSVAVRVTSPSWWS